MAVITSKVVQVPEWVKLLDNFADNEWSAIIWACQTGNVPETWTVGSQKPMTINGTNYAIDIIGLYHDDYADGSGKAPITFQMHDCYATHYAMNGTNTNSGGWTNSAMRSTHLPAIFATMPEEVQAAIREVNKLTSAGSQSDTIISTADKLFLLSEVEIFGALTFAKSGEGNRYAFYAAGNSAVKNYNGGGDNWWERSPMRNDNMYFCSVSREGGTNGLPASVAVGVAFAFCF